MSPTGPFNSAFDWTVYVRIPPNADPEFPDSSIQSLGKTVRTTTNHLRTTSVIFWFTYCAFLFAGMLTQAAHVAPAQTSTDQPPNVLFILTDDQGYGDLGVNGHPYIKTPNLDRLARQGTSFTQFYVSGSVCSPTRASFLTGRFPAEIGIDEAITGNKKKNDRKGVRDWLNPDLPTLPRMLQDAGYATAHVGKWHLTGWGLDGPRIESYGFDHRLSLSARMNDFLPFMRTTSHDHAKSSLMFVREAMQFIEHNRDRPWYCQIWTRVPHAELNPTDRQLARYEHLEAKPGDFESYMKPYLSEAGDVTRRMKTYAAAITGLDRDIGKLMDYLKRNDLYENTIVVFTSDNGPEHYRVGPGGGSVGAGSTGELRGRKRSIYEGGIRMPCIVRWPDNVPANKTSATVWASVDLFPTLAELVGAEIPDSVDGENVLDIWKGADRSRTTPLFWFWDGWMPGKNPEYRPPELAVRDGPWKLFSSTDGKKVELYYIPEDPQERKNVAGERPEVVNRLRKQVMEWYQTEFD